MKLDEFNKAKHLRIQLATISKYLCNWDIRDIKIDEVMSTLQNLFPEVYDIVVVTIKNILVEEQVRLNKEFEEL